MTDKISDNRYWAKLALSLMDLTSLNDDDSDDGIRALCAAANTAYGQTAAVCVYPRFVKTALTALEGTAKSVKVATVTNFPHGNDDVETALRETEAAIDNGAHEVDVVFPYRALIDGNENVGATIVAACKAFVGDKTLKIIIESGELKTPELIRRASEIAIENGADFIKTSTGKVPVNATLEAAEIMLKTIKDSDKAVGFKAAGGVRSVADATAYLQLTENIMGADWISPETFRFGASGLLDSLLATLNGETSMKNEAKNGGSY